MKKSDNSLHCQKSVTRRLALLAAACCLHSVASAQSTVRSPWDAAAIHDHVDHHQFTGDLDAKTLKTLVSAGEQLFVARFNTDDGVGRPMSTQAIIPTKRKRQARNQFARTAGLDANACSSCHNDPIVGGAGDFSVNVFVSEGFQNTDFDNTDPQFSNERNTNHLFGAGLIELLAREITTDLQSQRSTAIRQARQTGERQSVTLLSKGINYGQLHANPDGIVDLSDIEGLDHDLIIRPFSQKGVMTSLRQFTINALNHHHGMLAEERYGKRWTGQSDFDEDGKHNEINPGDVSALVAWQATRPPPGRLLPAQADWQDAAEAGETLFNAIGCATCHRPALPLRSLLFADPGPLDSAGTRRTGEDNADAVYNLALYQWAQQLPTNDQGDILVPLFGDLKRHKIADQEVAHLGNELLAQRFVERDVFITAELWGVASTAPYGHRGDLTTMTEVIEAHGGDARTSRDQFVALAEQDRQSVIAFLATLKIEPDTVQNEVMSTQSTAAAANYNDSKAELKP